MQFGSERRKTARVLHEAPVNYTPYRLLLPRLEETSRRGTCVDASEDARGLGFVTRHPLFTGRKLLVVAGGAERSGEVRWVGAVPEGYRVGVSLDTEPFEAQSI